MSDLAVGRARYPKINLPELNFRALFDAVPVPCLVFLPDGPAFTVVAVNRTFEQATLIKPEEVLGRSLPEVSRENLGAVYGDDLGTSVHRVLDTKAADTMAIEECGMRPPGFAAPAAERGRLPRYWRPSNVPVIGDAGDVTCIIHRLEDVTEIVESQRLVSERQRIEERLLATEARFSLAFAQAPTGMALLTPEGAITDVNQAFVDMLGYSRQELISGDSSQYTHPDDIELTKNFLSKLRDGPENSGNLEKRFLRRDGEIFWVCASAAMRRDDLGRPAQIIAIVEDITARKHAEARYGFLAESIPPIVWTAMPDGKFEYINRRGIAYIGAPAGKMLGGWWAEWVHPDEQEQAAARWNRSLETGEPFEIEFRLKRASDGSWRWFLARALPLATDRGQIVQWFGTCTDIEDQKQADANLLHQWQNFDTALSHTPDFTYIFDCSGRVIYVNRALLSVWQQPLEAARGKNFYDLEYPPELAERLQRKIQEVVATRQEVHDQMPLAGPGGEIRYYDYTFVPVFGGDGSVEAVGGSARDITEHIRIEEALAASEERLRQVFAQAPVAIVVFRGPDFIVELANPYYQALVQGRELVGRRFADVVPELSENVWDAFHRVLDTGEAFVATDFHVPYDQDGDGVIEDHWFNVVYHPLRERDGTVSGMVAVSSEVTAQVISRQNLETVNRRLEEFTYVASHDLREPLRMINMYSQLVQRRIGKADATLNEYVGYVQQGAARMDRLIQDLLSFSTTVDSSEIEAGNSADLSASLSEALLLLKKSVDESGAVITFQPLPRVQGDTNQFAHVFQNLISNALKYRKPNIRPQICISAAEDGDRWVISIRDNGIGFDPGYADQIFGLFKRLHKDEYSGTGVGLAICQRIVERYGGQVWAEGQPGEGATFYFSAAHLEQ